MNPKTPLRARDILVPLACLLLAATAGAQAPALMHYQGRLTNSSGAPITTAQTVYFSLWLGGTAATAGSGAQRYREHTTITPSATGVFEHTIGSGTADLLTLSAADFNTTTPLYLQIEVGSVGTTMLPRARMTSVAYAFLATRATTAGTADYATTAGSATASGTPRVTSVVDKTGGSVVIGDLIQINGSGLAGAKVAIGGRTAPIVSAADTALVCQVPAGTTMGYNAVAVIDAANGLASVTVAHVNVHRLLVWVSVGTNPQLIVVDALTRQMVAAFNVTMGLDATIPHLQMAFANEGSLALVPSNYSQAIYAIDLTANPPAMQTVYCGASRACAVAVSPDNGVAIVSDVTGGRLLVGSLNKTAPPYTASPFASFVNFTPTATTAWTLTGPRGAAFVGNCLLTVCSTLNSRLYAFRRTAGTANFQFYAQQNLASPNGNIINMLQLTTGAAPFAIYPSRDLTRLEVLTQAANNLTQYYVAPEGFGYGGAGDSLSVGSEAWGVAASADGVTLFVADAATNLLHVINIAPTPALLGDMENSFDPRPSTAFDYQLAALEPAEGRQLAVGTDNYKLYFLTRDGGTLAPLGTYTTSGSARVTYELQYQP